MRAPAIALVTVISASSVAAQTPVSTPSSRSCAPIAKQLASEPVDSGSRLFVKTRAQGYVPVPQKWALGSDFKLPEYVENQALQFIYVPQRKRSENKQYLAIRTRSFGDGQSSFVGLKKQRQPFAKDVLYGTYKDYHEGATDNSRVLRHYHNWYPDRSDEPESTRRSYLFTQSDWGSEIFKKRKDVSARRLLTIRFTTTDDHVTCVPFALGPHLATACDAESDETDCDQISLLNPFTIDITEARTGEGEAGATFSVQYQP